MEAYKLKDTRKEVRATGRVDHTFIYTKELDNLGDAHYLLTTVVTGDAITTVDHSIDIPEAFKRSFKNIRSLNDTIYYFATIIVYLFYLILGCLGAILFFLKKNWLLPKPALYFGLGLAFLQLLAGLNQFPFLWFSYDTAQSTQVFLFQSFLNLIFGFVTWSALFTTTFVAAEALTRRAFGSHIQLWSAWKLPASSSYTMLGKTIASYCIVAVDMAFVILLYAVGMRYFGWWSPSSALTDPNILSTYIPAVSVLAKAAAAGFWEEALFRAVPIATAAIIGKKLGYPRTGLILGLLIQPLIFGAAHANYPGLPSYVRIVELFLPSLSWGIIYVLFGLIPVMIYHVIFDAILFALPLFVSDAPGMLLQKVLVIAACALPLLFVLASRLRTGRWLEVPSALYNGAWRPVEADFKFEKSETNVIKGSPKPFSQKALACFMIIGLLSLTGCVFWDTFDYLAPSLTISRSQAVDGALQSLKDKNIDASWQIMPTVYSPLDDVQTAPQHVFIWQNYDQTTYKGLLGNYLAAPAWNVRIARFKGDLQHRAEEFQVLVNNSGIVRNVHVLPQAAAGEKLDEKAARTQVLQFVKQKYGLEALHEVSAQSEVLPNRVDWHFAFSQPGILPETTERKDLARVGVTLAGDSVSNAAQSIHVPEEWTRLQKMRNSLVQCIATLRWFAWFIVLMLAAMQGALLWRRGQLRTKRMLIAMGIYALFSLIAMMLNFPQIIASFNTAQPFSLQLGSFSALTGAQIVIEALIIGILASSVVSTTVISGLPTYQKVIGGIVSGLAWAAAVRYIQAHVYPSSPTLPSFFGAAAYLPSVVCAWHFIGTFIKQTLYTQVLVYFAAGSRWKALCVLVVFLLLCTPYESTASLGQWLIALLIIGATSSLVYYFIVRAEPKMVPILTAIPYILQLVDEATARAMPESPLASILAIVAIILLAFVMSRMGCKKDADLSK